MTAAPALSPPPTFQRGAQRQQRAPECRPFGLIYDALPNHPEETIRQTIDRLAAERKQIDVANVRALLVARVPMPPPALVMVPTAKSAPVAEPPAMDDGEPVRMAKLAERMGAPRHADRLAERLARCDGRPALTAAQEAEYQAIIGGRTVKFGISGRWQDFGALPSANAYAAGCGE